MNRLWEPLNESPNCCSRLRSKVRLYAAFKPSSRVEVFSYLVFGLAIKWSKWGVFFLMLNPWPVGSITRARSVESSIPAPAHSKKWLRKGYTSSKHKSTARKFCFFLVSFLSFVTDPKLALKVRMGGVLQPLANASVDTDPMPPQLLRLLCRAVRSRWFCVCYMLLY